MAKPKPRICVIGACNIDLISYVDRMPAWGETLHGSKFHMGYGGKGANQAVMAAKFGADVIMISKVGQDVFGDDTIKNFDSFGIDTTHVYQTDTSMSGVAPILVEPGGNNSIVIVTGANDLLTKQEIDKARNAIAQADLLVCQWEIPLEASLHAMKLAKQSGTRVIFNPAPARSKCPDEVFEHTDIFCPNESEAALISGQDVDTNEGLQSAAKHFHDRGAKTVIVTLGARGSFLSDFDRQQLIPAIKVNALDTTGAGDCFIGSLAYFLVSGDSMEVAVEKSNKVAALSVQKAGTQTSFPDTEELAGLFD